jgi:glutathione S-transferase
MQLLASNTSPYVRKVRVVILEKHLSDQVQDVLVNVFELPENVRAANPLGKVPAILFDDGRSLIGSSLIVEYLDSLGTAPKLIPDGDARWAAKRWEAIADGILDAAVQVRIEQMLRPLDMQYAPEIQRQFDKVERALEVLESECDQFKNSWHSGSIAIACTLSWLDLRFAPLNWRERFPKLDQFEKSCHQHDSYVKTAFVV